MAKSSLLTFDAFAKTEEDVRIRTRSGGLITLGCILATLWLLLNEWTQFNTVVKRPQLVLDRDRNLKLDFVLDITFPNMPCSLLTLDIMDDSGDIQLDLLNDQFTKTRLDSHGKPISTEHLKVGEATLPTPADDKDYCGPCYGGKDQNANKDLPPEKQVCCQTCDDVRMAYSEKGWAFFDGRNIEQCEREGYVERIQSQLHEGCRVQGAAKLNRIQGNIHFAPGKSVTNRRAHSHDTSLYRKHSHLSFSHIIHQFSFGPNLESSSGPLDNHEALLEDGHNRVFTYFTKIVPTRFEMLEGIPLETAQFSATSHIRPVDGGFDGDDAAILHVSGGIPSVIFYFEMSPLKVINKEQHAISWSGFILNCVTSIGGVLAVGTVIDKLAYRAQRSMWGKKSQ